MTPTLHPLRFSLIVALLAAVVGGAVTTLALWFHLDTDSGVYVIVATVITLGIIISLAHAALLYGRSRNQDGRPAPREYWWLAARSGFMDVANVQLIGMIIALVLIGTGLIIWRAVEVLQMGTLAASAVLIIFNLAIIWALLGAYAAARIATPAVVIGGFNAADAMKVGWRLYRQAGGHLLAAAVEALLGRAIVAVALAVVAYAAVTRFSGADSTVAALGGGAGIALILFCASLLTLEIDTKLWLAQYRHLATLRPPAERIRLLTGRVQSHKSP